MSSLNKAVESGPLILSNGLINKKKSGLALINSLGLIENSAFSNEETGKFTNALNMTNNMNLTSNKTVNGSSKSDENLIGYFEVLVEKDSSKVCCDPQKVGCLIM